MNSPARLKDVALAAGLSISGVSRALNGDPSMSKETRARVLDLAASMGYEPVAAARSLRDYARTGKTAAFQGTIGHLVYPHEVHMMRQKDSERRFPWIYEIERRASSHGYKTDILTMKEGACDQRELARVIRARGIRGVIISGAHNDLRAFRLDWSSMAALSINASPSVRFLSNLSVPYFQDTYYAVHELVRRNYRRIGFVMIGNILDQFLGGYETAAHRNGLPVIKPVVSVKGVPAKLEQWIEKNRLDCLLTTTGLELLEAIRATGRRVPEDIGMCCIDDFDAPGLLSGMHQPRLKLAGWAVDMLHTMIQRHEFGVPDDPVEVHFPSTWTEGATVLPRQDGASPPANSTAE